MKSPYPIFTAKFYVNDFRYGLLKGLIKPLKQTKLYRKGLIDPKMVLDEVFISPFLVLCERTIVPSGPECRLQTQRVFFIVPNHHFAGQFVLSEGINVKSSVLIGWELFSLDPELVCSILDKDYFWLFKGYKDGDKTCLKV